MKVLKFGGTSVGSVNSILSVKKIVEAIEEPVIVVVSALGGITDKLLATSTMASKGDLAYEKDGDGGRYDGSVYRRRGIQSPDKQPLVQAYSAKGAKA
jgi:aspartokinase